MAFADVTGIKSVELDTLLNPLLFDIAEFAGQIGETPGLESASMVGKNRRRQDGALDAARRNERQRNGGRALSDTTDILDCQKSFHIFGVFL